MKTRMNQSGFTLIELLVVMVILGILASLAIPRLAGRTEDARIQAAHADIHGGIGIALDLYEVDMGRYPEALDALVTRPGDSQRWKGPYLKKGLPKDPWGQSYSYRFPGSMNPASYDLYSFGPDSKDSSGDEITNWKEEARG